MSDVAAKQDDDDDDDDAADDPYEKQNRFIERLLERHVAIIAEHCDSVRIIATVNRGDGVYGRISRGEGNYFAQYGSIRDWLVQTEQETRNVAGE